MKRVASDGAVGVLVITRASRRHSALRRALRQAGLQVRLVPCEAAALLPLGHSTGLVLVDLDAVNGLSWAAVERLNARMRRVPLLGLCNGPWPPPGPAASRLRVDGFARPEEWSSIALAALGTVAAAAAPYLH